MFTVSLSFVRLGACAFGVILPDGSERGPCCAVVVVVGTLSAWSNVVMCFNE